MKCYHCENPAMDMVEELKEKGYTHMSNEPLSDQLSEYYLKTGIFPNLKIVKLGLSQWIYVNETGKDWVELQFRKLKDQAELQLSDINQVLNEVIDDATYDEPERGYTNKWNLNLPHFSWFVKTHKRHLAAMRTENQKKYAYENILNVRYDHEKDTVNVYYEDEWWHYDRNYNWY